MISDRPAPIYFATATEHAQTLENMENGHSESSAANIVSGGESFLHASVFVRFLTFFRLQINTR